MNTKKDWKYRFENFEKAFRQLSEAIERIKKNFDDDLLRAGFIQTYEFTFELAWKTLKDYFEEQGFADISAPKQVLRVAFQEGYIQDGEVWIEALDGRNRSSHIYNEDLAKELTKDILEKYFPLIRDLYFTLKKEKNDE